MTMTLDNTVFETFHRTEDWKYTNVSALSKVDFGVGTQVDAVEIEAFDLAVNNPFVVFVNGVFNEQRLVLLMALKSPPTIPTRLQAEVIR